MTKSPLLMATILALAAANLPQERGGEKPADTKGEEPRTPDTEPEIVNQLREARRLRAERKKQKGHWK